MQHERRSTDALCSKELFLSKTISTNTCIFVSGDGIACTLLFSVW